jgi:hypothetical protein
MEPARGPAPLAHANAPARVDLDLLIDRKCKVHLVVREVRAEGGIWFTQGQQFDNRCLSDNYQAHQTAHPVVGGYGQNRV